MANANIKARPDGYWNDSGVSLREGETVKIKYLRGNWKPNPHWGPVDGKGDSRYKAGKTYLRPGSAEGALIGKFGGNNTSGGGQTFYVGNERIVRADESGILWLTVNDEKVGFGDNNGELIVEVTPM